MRNLILVAVALLFAATSIKSQTNLIPLTPKEWNVGVSINDRVGPVLFGNISRTFRSGWHVGLFGGRSIIIKGDEKNTDFYRAGLDVGRSLFYVGHRLHTVANGRVEIDKRKKNLYQATIGLSYVFIERQAPIGLSFEGGYLVDDRGAYGFDAYNGFFVTGGMDLRYKDYIITVRVGRSTIFKFLYVIR